MLKNNNIQNDNDFRLKTFKSWDNQDFAKKLASNGFIFTGKKDIIQCVFCFLEISDCKNEQFTNPKDIHDKFYKFCPKNLKINFENYNDRLLTFKEGFYKSINLIEKLAKSGFVFTGNNDTVICIECNIKLYDWSDDDDPFIEHKKFSPNCKLCFDEEKFIDMTCIICKEKNKCICFIPCGHLACCIDCFVKYDDKTTCFICKNVIEKTLKIFY